MRISDLSSDVCSSGLRVLVVALAICDESAFPDAVKGAVEVDAGAVRRRELLRRRDNHFEQRVDEIVAVLLTAGERARIAAQERKMSADFVAETHARSSLLDQDRKSTRLNSSH